MRLGFSERGMNSFDDWFAESRFVLDLCEEDGEREAPARLWARGVYEEHGPLELDDLRTLVVATRLKAAERAFEILSDEVTSSGYEMLAGRIEIIRQDQIWGAESAVGLLGQELYALAVADSVEEVGEIVQDQIIDREMKVWPVCGWHRTGLRARVVDGRAVWWCRAGGHVERNIFLWRASGSDLFPAWQDRTHV